MAIFIFLAILLTPDSHIEALRVSGPYTDYTTCLTDREQYLETAAVINHYRIATPCVEVDAHELPYCIAEPE